MAAKRKGAGGNLNRSQVVTVRLDPKLKFATEMAARKQRRTVSSFIEWAVEQAIAGVEVRNEVTVNEVMGRVWDVEDADRLVKLALNFPELLTYEEERLWKIIQEFSHFWDGESGVINEQSANFDLIRFNWKTLQKIIDGDATSSDLTSVPF